MICIVKLVMSGNSQLKVDNLKEAYLVFIKFPMAINDEFVLMFSFRKIDNCIEVLLTENKYKR